MRTVRPIGLVPLLAALLVAGCGKSHDWKQTIEELPLDADEVVAAVASLPECEAVRRGGRIVWKPLVHCNGSPVPVSGCTYPTRDPPLVEIVYRTSAWDPPGPGSNIPTLAHELCHVCGYYGGPDGEAQADACALRAWAMVKN